MLCFYGLYVFFFYGYGYHRELHKLTHSFPTRRSSDLMVVPFPAGGPTDNVARALAEAMRPTPGQTVVVENKAGAGGTIGTSQVARAKPDGYNFLLMHIKIGRAHV